MRWTWWAGAALAMVGNVGWAVVIGTFEVAWVFWALAAGTLVGAVGSAFTEGKVLAAGGWGLAAAGALALLWDQFQDPFPSDFPAPYLYYVGFLVVAGASITARRGATRPGELAFLGGLACAAAGGLWWTGLDVVRGSLDYTWANASLALGYTLLAYATASRAGNPAIDEGGSRKPPVDNRRGTAESPEREAGEPRPGVGVPIQAGPREVGPRPRSTHYPSRRGKGASESSLPAAAGPYHLVVFAIPRHSCFVMLLPWAALRCWAPRLYSSSWLWSVRTNEQSSPASLQATVHAWRVPLVCVVGVMGLATRTPGPQEAGGR